MVQLDEAFAFIHGNLDGPQVEAIVGVVVGVGQAAAVAQDAGAGAAKLDVGLVFLGRGVLVQRDAVGDPFGAFVAQDHFGQHGLAQIGAERVGGLGQHVQFGCTEMGHGGGGSGRGGHEGDSWAR
ncbi:hypothetical protein D3C71_1755050 [compost metagenome]